MFLEAVSKQMFQNNLPKDISQQVESGLISLVGKHSVKVTTDQTPVVIPSRIALDDL